MGGRALLPSSSERTCSCGSGFLYSEDASSFKYLCSKEVLNVSSIYWMPSVCTPGPTAGAGLDPRSEAWGVHCSSWGGLGEGRGRCWRRVEVTSAWTSKDRQFL